MTIDPSRLQQIRARRQGIERELNIGEAYRRNVYGLVEPRAEWADFLNHAAEDVTDLLAAYDAQQREIAELKQGRQVFMDSKFWEGKAVEYQRRAEAAEAKADAQQQEIRGLQESLNLRCGNRECEWYAAFERYEELEARLCPEDVGFEEWIAILIKQRNRAEAELARLVGSGGPVSPDPGLPTEKG